MNYCEQYVLLSKDGVLINSCNSIFDTSSLHPTSILNAFPLVESIFRELLQLPLSENRLITRVVSNSTFLKGIYDFVFTVSVGEANQRQLSWVIRDKTRQYQLEQRQRQQYQEQFIAQELASISSTNRATFEERRCPPNLRTLAVTMGDTPRRMSIVVR